MSNSRLEMLEIIRKNISNYGYHVYQIVGGASPRFSYTIGISQIANFELIIAGASFYSSDDEYEIIKQIVSSLNSGLNWQEARVEVDNLGYFTLKSVHTSWVKKMMYGALDFYGVDNLSVLQIIPEDVFATIDIPDLSRPWDATSQPIWKWLDEDWIYPVSESSIVITNIDALKGECITEIMRWEDECWEMFAGAGPDIPKEELREVPLGVLIQIDNTLKCSTSLDVGKGLWRDGHELKWNAWG